MKTRTCHICLKETPRLGNHLKTHARTVDDVKHPILKKQKLVEEFGHKCQNCGGVEWLGQPIPLQLDHIDGHPDHNEKTNLRLLCPNCHAQTPTWCGKNMGRNGSTRRSLLMKGRKKYR